MGAPLPVPEPAAAHPRFERAPRLAQKINVIDAHEREAEDGDVEAAVFQRHVPDVARRDALVGGHEVERVHCVVHRGGELRFPAAKVAHDRARPLAAPLRVSCAAVAAQCARHTHVTYLMHRSSGLTGHFSTCSRKPRWYCVRWQ